MSEIRTSYKVSLKVTLEHENHVPTPDLVEATIIQFLKSRMPIVSVDNVCADFSDIEDKNKYIKNKSTKLSEDISLLEKELNLIRKNCNHTDVIKCIAIDDDVICKICGIRFNEAEEGD